MIAENRNLREIQMLPNVGHGLGVEDERLPRKLSGMALGGAAVVSARNACFTSLIEDSNRIPAEAFALLFGYFLENGQRLRAAVLAAGGEDGIYESDGGGIRGAKRSGFDAGEKDFIAFAGKRGNVSVGDSDAVGAAGMGQMDAFDRLAQAAAEADGQNEVALVYGAD